MRQRLGLAAAIVIVAGACSGAASSTIPPTPVPTAPPTSTPAARTLEPTPAPTLAHGVIGMFDLDFRPSAIVATDDEIWAEDHAQTNRVYAIDPDTGRTRATIDVVRPCDLVAAFGRVWIADLDVGRLIWVDPAKHEIGGEVSGLQRPCGVQAVDGAIWLAVDDGLARVDPETGNTSITKLSSGAFPGSGGPLWAALYETGDLVRIDPASGEVLRTVAHPAGRTEGPPVAAGFDSVWVGDWASDRLYRLDATSGAVQAEIAATQPTRLLVTADAVWHTSYDGGVVERIDPATNDVVYRAELGGNINGIAEGFGAIWVTDTGNGLLYRIDPAATGLP